MKNRIKKTKKRKNRISCKCIVQTLQWFLKTIKEMIIKPVKTLVFAKDQSLKEIEQEDHSAKNYKRRCKY